MYHITIIVNGVERHYKGDFDLMFNRDWTLTIQDMIETIEQYEKD